MPRRFAVESRWRAPQQGRPYAYISVTVKLQFRLSALSSKINPSTNLKHGNQRGMGLFLFRQEKYPKEADSREALEREIYRTTVLVAACYPDFKPPSLENPSRPLRVSYPLRSLVL